MLNSIRTALRDADDLNNDHGGGAGSALNPAILISAGVATFVATVVSVVGIVFQLKNYRKPLLQRMTVRIMIMVPLYAISSLISLFSLNAAFAIDAIRDIYEAFVIYNFFSLIVAYLGGERSVLILLHGRPPRNHFFPVNLFVRELDASDPFTFLFMKRGILQYVQVKPILTAATLILKATGTYKEGELSWSAGYLYISFVYNISICLSLYCLATFWMCVSADIKPFRPMPKFLCVKGILFFSFWQAITISALVAAGVIKRIGPYTDSEHISLAITDTLICYEMPLFALAHWFAFSHTDYIDKHLHYAARMPFYYAFRDAFGFLDVLEDGRTTLRGGVDYRTFEPVEGGMHQGVGRDRRIKAGLRYSKGGQNKYWLPTPQGNSRIRHTGPISALKLAAEERHQARYGYAPIMDTQADRIFQDETAEANGRSLAMDDDNGFCREPGAPIDIESHEDEWSRELTFEDPDQETERLFADSRKLLFGDYHYPCIDVSSEEARSRMWEEEEQILKDQRAAFASPTTRALAQPTGLLAATDGRGARHQGYGAVGTTAGNSLRYSPALRSWSDADPHVARSTVAGSPKGKGPSAISSSSKGRKGVYGGWAEPSTSWVDPHSTTMAINTPIVADHPASIPIIDYTPHEPFTPDTDTSKGAIDLRYARTTTRPLAPRIPGAPTTTTQVGLGLDVGNAAMGERGAYGAPPSALSRPDSVSSVPPSPTNPAATGSGSSLSVSYLRPDVSGHSDGESGRGRKSSPRELPRDAIDLVVEDVRAKQDEMTRERRKGGPAVKPTGERRIYRREYVARGDSPVQVEAEGGGVDVRVGAGDTTEDDGRAVMERREATVRDEDGRQEAEFTSNPASSTLPVVMSGLEGREGRVDYPAAGARSDFELSTSIASSPHAVMPPRATVFKVEDEDLVEDMVLETTPLVHTRVLLSTRDDDILNPWA